MSGKSHLADRFDGSESGLDEENDIIIEPLVYDPLDASYSVLLDDLPGAPRINDNGIIETQNNAYLILLFIPVLCLSIHVHFILRGLKLISY